MQEPINTLSIATSVSGIPGFAPYRPVLFLPTRVQPDRQTNRIGNVVVHGNHLTWIGAPGACGEISSACKVTTVSKVAPSRFAEFSSRQRRRRNLCLSAQQTAFDIVKGGFVRCNQTGFPPISIAILHRVIRPSMLKSRLLRRKTPPHARCRLRCQFYRNCQHDIFRGNAWRSFALDFIFMVFARPCFRVCVASTCSTRKCRYQRPVRQTRREWRYASAADDGHPRQGHALFRPHYVAIP